MHLTDGHINIQTNGAFTLMSFKLYRFLGFTEKNNVRVLGITAHHSYHLDHRIQKYYEKYYAIAFSGEYNTLVADQAFDISVYKPHLIKVITPIIESYVCGGGYKKVLSVIPVGH